MTISTQGWGGHCITTMGWGCRTVREALVEVEFDLEITTLVLRGLEIDTEVTRSIQVETDVAYLMLVALSGGDDLEIDTEMSTDQEI